MKALVLSLVIAFSSSVVFAQEGCTLAGGNVTNREGAFVRRSNAAVPSSISTVTTKTSFSNDKDKIVK